MFYIMRFSQLKAIILSYVKKMWPIKALILDALTFHNLTDKDHSIL